MLLLYIATQTETYKDKYSLLTMTHHIITFIKIGSKYFESRVHGKILKGRV